MSGLAHLFVALIVLSLIQPVRADTSFPEIGPGDHLERGVKSYREGDLDRAVTEFKRAVSLDPKLASAHYHLAKIHLIRKDVYRAFYSLREVVGLEPSNVKAKKALKELNGELLARVQEDIRQRKNLAVAYNVMGFLLISQNRLAAGVKREEFALELDPRMAEAYDDLAWAAYKDRDLERAFEMVSKAFELDPTKGSISAHYAQLFNLKRLGVPFEAKKTPRAAPAELASAAISDGAVDGHPPLDAGLSGSIQPPRASDLESLVAEDQTLVDDYLKSANLMAAAPAPPRTGPRSLPSAAAPVVDSAAEAARKKKVAEATRKALQESYDLARKKEAAGDFKGAMQLYAFIRESDPAFTDVAVRMNDIHRTVEALQNLDAAVSSLKASLYQDALMTLQSLDRVALERGPSKLTSVDNLIGEAAYGARQYDLAKVHLRKWLDGHQDDAGARYLLVRTLQAQGDWSGGLDEISILLSKHPEASTRYPDLYGLKAKFWVKTYFVIVVALALLWSAMSSGYVYFKVKRGSHFRHVRRLIERVQLAVKKEKWADVLKETERLPAGLAPAEEVFLGCAAGMAFLSTGDLTRATKLQRELLSAFPEEPQVHHLTARIMLLNRDFSHEAIEEYHKLLSVEPNNRALLEALNSHYQARAPESDEAMKILDRLLELDPTNSDFRYYRALRHLRQKDFSEVAKAAFTRVLEIDPQRSDVRAGLARAHFEARNYLEAIKESKRTLEMDLRNAELHKILLTSYARLSMQQEAVKEYRQMVARHPEMPELKSYLAQVEQLKGEEFGDDTASREADALYEKGVRAYQEGRHKDAIGPLTAAFNAERLRMSAGTLLVRSYLKGREIRTALTIFERLDIMSTKTPDDFLLSLCYDIAEVYLKETKRDKALELYTFICRANVSFRDAFQRLEALQSGDALV